VYLRERAIEALGKEAEAQDRVQYTEVVWESAVMRCPLNGKKLSRFGFGSGGCSRKHPLFPGIAQKRIGGGALQVEAGTEVQTPHHAHEPASRSTVQRQLHVERDRVWAASIAQGNRAEACKASKPMDHMNQW